METFEASLFDLQPSQLYICSDKLAEVEHAMGSAKNAPIDPLPVKHLGSRTVLTDGHTRALAAFRRGRMCVPVYWETDELDWEAYRICVHWCLEEGVRSVPDLEPRVVARDQYEELWYKRCQAMHRELAEERKSKETANTRVGRIPRLEFDIWGSIPFSQELTSGPTAQQILLTTRMEPKSLSEIQNAVGADERLIRERVEEMARWDLLVPDKSSPARWVTNLPIYISADMAASEEIGWKYAQVEGDILRSSLACLRESYESCDISTGFPWESMSLIVVGALLADLCVYDRVRFFPKYLCEDYLPPLHPDGHRWEYVAYESQKPRFPRKRWAFCQNLRIGESEAGGLATFGYFDPPPERQPAPRSLFDRRLRGLAFVFAGSGTTIEKISELSSLGLNVIQEALSDWMSRDPPAVSVQDGKYSLNIPIFSRSDLARLLVAADTVAGTIHTNVTVPWHDERAKIGKEMGLRFPLPEGYLTRDIALQILVEEGRLSEVPDAPVPWNFGVWGWEGRLPLWEEATKAQEET